MSIDTTESEDRAHDAAIKYDYFIASLTLALAGYLMAHAAPPGPHLSPEWILILAIVILSGSCFLGLRRAALYVVVLYVQLRKRGLESRIEEIVSASADPKYPAVMDAVRGGVLSKDDALKHVQDLRDGLSKTEGEEQRYLKRASLLYAWRDYSLWAGFLLALVARVLGARVAL